MMWHRATSFLVLALTALVGCATEPAPLDKTQPDAVNKKMFDGDWFYKLTVVDTEWNNNATFIGEEAFFGSVKVRWEITEDKLNAYMVPQTYKDAAGNSVTNSIGLEAMVLSFNIKGHFDIKYMENTTTREELNVIYENTDRPWDQREYMRVDWSESQVANLWAPMSGDLLTGDLVREPVSVKENVEFFDANNKMVDTRQWDPKSDAKVTAINIDTKESIRSGIHDWWDLYYGAQPPVTVKWRHSLMKADKRDYVAMDYRDDFFRRFGYFRTEYETYDPLRAVRESDKKYFIDRWNTKGNNKIVFTLSPSFPTQDTELVKWTREVVDAWNKVMQEATGRTDRVVVLEDNAPRYDSEGQKLLNTDGSERWQKELGDMRYSFINYTTRPQNASPLGYGPSYTDPDSGEIISATVNVYGNWVDYVVTRSMDLYDLVAGNCTVDDVAAGHYYNEESKKCDGGVADGEVYSDLARGADGQPVVASAHSAEDAQAINHMALNFLTPGLMNAYFPTGNINKKAEMPISRAQLSELRSKVALVAKQELQDKLPLNLSALQAIKGTAYEQMMIPRSSLGGAISGRSTAGLGGASEAQVLEKMSPANRLSDEALSEVAYRQYLASVQCRLEPDHFDPAIVAFVEQNKDLPRAEIREQLRHWVYFTTTLHEMGHTLGLRHNFRGSIDRANFIPKYEELWGAHWDDVEELKRVYEEDIAAGKAPGLAYREYVEKARMTGNARARYSVASIMDYTGDWDGWLVDDAGVPVVPSYDRAAILFGYGNKVEVLEASDAASAKLYDDATGKMLYSTWNWKVVPYQEGDLDMANRFDPLGTSPAPEGKDGRVVRFYQFCSDEKVFDDAFCTRFDSGVTATEIVRNFIEDQYRGYFFKNFKRDNAGFDGRRGGYFMNKWLWTYYMMAKFLPQLQLHSMWYPETWDNLVSDTTFTNVLSGPEDRKMLPGYVPVGAEDLLRASLMVYQYMLYDVLMRPDYGNYAQTYTKAGQKIWTPTEEAVDPLNPQPRASVPLGPGWGWGEKWDSQADVSTYYDHLTRIGVELDKIVALEVLSIPAALNDPLAHEKANGLSFWNSIWTGNGAELWEVMQGMVTDEHGHQSNPWCADENGNLMAYPVNLGEGLLGSGLLTDSARDPSPRCPEGSYPIEPGMDALFAIYPMFWSIAGASHPWYTNAMSERLDSQVKGGNHRFDIPEGAEVAEFTNPMGTKTYQAVQTSDGTSISFALVRQAEGIMNRYAFLEACDANLEPETGFGTYDRTCEDVSSACDRYRPADWCFSEGWISAYDNYDSPYDFKFRDVDRVEAMLIMAQDMVDIAGHKSWRTPGVLEEP